MAKGDFIFTGIDTTTFSAKQLSKGSKGKTAGLTLTYLFVTIKLTKKEVVDEAGETRCVCTAKIVDYSLQVNAYVDKKIKKKLPQRLVIAHELFHVREKKNIWEKKKQELDTLLDKIEYPCGEEAKLEVIQDVVVWFVTTFFGDPTEEERARMFEEVVKELVKDAGEKNVDKVLDGIFGKKRLVENKKKAKKIKVAPRFRSRVKPTFKGSCD